MAKNYAGAKGEFVDRKMKEGLTNKQAHKVWKKSAEKKEWDKKRWDSIPVDDRENTSNIDRSQNSPWQDWAETADDL